MFYIFNNCYGGLPRYIFWFKEKADAAKYAERVLNDEWSKLHDADRKTFWPESSGDVDIIEVKGIKPVEEYVKDMKDSFVWTFFLDPDFPTVSSDFDDYKNIVEDEVLYHLDVADDLLRNSTILRGYSDDYKQLYVCNGQVKLSEKI